MNLRDLSQAALNRGESVGQYHHLAVIQAIDDAARDRPATDPAGPTWTAAQHREDAKLVQAAMQRIAERRRLVERRYGSIHVPIEDASDLLMALHRDGIYRPDKP